MAIIVDPDNIDRRQIIFAADRSQEISIYPVGSAKASGITGYATGSTQVFPDVNATFITAGATAGDILCIYTDQDAAHYVISSVPAETQLIIDSSSWNGNTNRSAFSGSTATNLSWEVRNPLTGSVVDGVTLQALYSFAKEEWRADSDTNSFLGYTDDLIRHEFPFEAITSEQFEIGGGTAHTNWSFFNDFTRKKVRTGGWERKNTATDSLSKYTGIITLGNLDTDSQVYYQPLSSSADPINFTFKGAVNEPILVSSSFSGFDTSTFLKLFVRKKARTYAGSQLSDIGVSTIQTIVNRFPLAHTDDPAIVASDAKISGSAPWRETHQLAAGSDGVKSDLGNGLGAFTSAGASFLAGPQRVAPGDVLELTNGSEVGFFTIVDVGSDTVLTASTLEDGPWTNESGITYTVDSTVILTGSIDGVITDIDGATGQLSSSTGGFTKVDTDDIVIITGPTSLSNHLGAYHVITASGDQVLTIDTSDQTFPTPGSGSIEFYVVEPGMYLQSKEVVLDPIYATSFTFNDTNPDQIVRSDGSWITDGVTAGTQLTVAGTTNNDTSVGTVYTVASVNALTATLVTTDTLTAESSVSASIVATDRFKRSIQGVKYGFKWRLFGNNTTLSQAYQFVQHQLRQTLDIDFGSNSSRGDVTDLLMQFSTPTATTFNMYIDDLSNADLNNVTFIDAGGSQRVNAFVAAGTISFNDNLQNDSSAVYRMFFSNDAAGDNVGNNYGTPNAIIVQDVDGNEITGSVGGVPSVEFTYDYDGNVQRGASSAGTDAPITVVAIGLNTAQFVIVNSTITRSKTNNVSLVSALERNYSNPS